MSQFVKFCIFIALALTPEIVLAHSPIKGIGNLFNGILHPLFAPAQLLSIIALGLWFGQNQPAKHQITVLAYLFAVIAGLLASYFSLRFNVSMALLLGASGIGLLIISNFKFPSLVYIACAMLLGFAIGLDSIQDDLSRKEKIISLFGNGVGIYFLLLYALALSESFSKKAWQTIAIRVLASWISASALMVLSLNYFANKG